VIRPLACSLMAAALILAAATPASLSAAPTPVPIPGPTSVSCNQVVEKTLIPFKLYSYTFNLKVTFPTTGYHLFVQKAQNDGGVLAITARYTRTPRFDATHKQSITVTVKLNKVTYSSQLQGMFSLTANGNLIVPSAHYEIFGPPDGGGTVTTLGDSGLIVEAPAH